MPSTPNFVESGIPFITSKNIKDGRIDLDNVSYISENDYLEISKNRKITKKDILITMIGTIGELAIVKEQKDFYGQNLFLVRIDNKIVLDEFFRHLFISSSTQNKLRNSQQNSNQGYLRKSNILDLNFDIPSLETQEKIVKVLDNFEAICKDLNIGLPAEEVKRQEQYQYYRDAIFNYLETGIIDNKGIGEREREQIN
ncbi:restriction endonuclease subunit S [Mycoplasmopsis gallinacea]|uniref:Type I restriction-modification system, S subunit n=1 Tax=Mycoplasmopsis gallinacea TaxID=29556 RepID=A0A449A3T5_9BACT|nr:restriction endonuclease subunit S [Mycoplasmopsis gallinacea]VEU58906.1 type I restriction-modification system, S subunit [Mycoplasmopsis gallinacea]